MSSCSFVSLFTGSHPDYWDFGIGEVGAANSTAIHTTSRTPEDRCVLTNHHPVHNQMSLLSDLINCLVGLCS